MKIGTKLVVIITAVNLVCIGGLTAVSLVFTGNQISSMANDNVKTVASDTGADIGRWIETTSDQVRVLGKVMSHFNEIKKEERRRLFNYMLQSVAVENPKITGTWAIFEPNALDGMDAQLANTEGTDATGRFLSYF